MSRAKILISLFMNILKNLQMFYEVYADSESVDWSAKEKIRKKLGERCYELNMQYIYKQMETIKRTIFNKNVKIYVAIEREIKEILEMHVR